jgi:NAD(P)-dependent dehydrogenase (short-subunit alcohol dehydrogenase family)
MSSIFELFSLQEKTAVIIGGTGELCGAVAEGYAAAGAEVVLVGRDPAKAEKRLDAIHNPPVVSGYFVCGRCIAPG